MTLNFAKLGEIRNDNTFQVYLRYLYKDTFTGRNVYEYIPTKKYLTAQDIELLKNEKLVSTLAMELLKVKDRTLELITNYYDAHNYYPSKAEVLAKTKQIGKSVFEYIVEYQKVIKRDVKESTYNTYCSTLYNFKLKLTTLQTVDRKQYIYDSDLFATPQTLKRIIDYYIELGFKNGYINLVKRLMVRFINYIRIQKGLPEIAFKTNLKVEYSHFKLSEEEVGYLLNFQTTKPSYLETQRIIKLNSLLGLRISEILGLFAEDIEFRKDHVLITILEKKKSKGREMVLPISEGTDYLKSIVEDVKSGKLFTLDKDDINYRLRRIAKATGKFNSLHLKVKNVGHETDTERLPKYECISTHSFRRFRIRANAKEHGLLLAQYYSGHSTLTAIEKNYLDDLDHNEVLEILLKTTKNI